MIALDHLDIGNDQNYLERIKLLPSINQVTRVRASLVRFPDFHKRVREPQSMSWVLDCPQKVPDDVSDGTKSGGVEVY